MIGYGTGLPNNCVEVKSDELAKSVDQAKAFINGKQAGQLITSNWTTHHWLSFLRALSDSLSQDQMKDLDGTFHFTQSGNSEILCDWLQHAIHSNYSAADDALEKFLIGVGRRKFLRPIYAALTSTPAGKLKAKNIYAKARPGYHAVSYNTIDEILK